MKRKEILQVGRCSAYRCTEHLFKILYKKSPVKITEHKTDRITPRNPVVFAGEMESGECRPDDINPRDDLRRIGQPISQSVYITAPFHLATRMGKRKIENPSEHKQPVIVP